MASKVKNKFYITTAIIYTNAAPHVGFALETVQADAIARFNRIKGKDVFFLTGSDEHGIKNQRAAKAAGKDPQIFVDENTALVKKMLKMLNISNDYYIRTTDKKNHYPTVQNIWKKLVESGDIYRKKYRGYYCSGCEAFIKESELVDGKCPNHNKKPEIVEEENYFFRLSKYQNQLIKIIESDEYQIIPVSRKNEILSFIKQGLEDVSFSRSIKSLQWGIPVPNDNEQIIYTWCDALTNYLSGIGYSSDKKIFEKYWPADIHLIGKDILKFHTAYWIAILLSAKIPLPKKLFVHGFITSKGRKMSKSLGNIIDPFEQIKKYGTDPVRFYLLKHIPSDSDGDYTDEAVINVINKELADDLGNLVYRILTLLDKYFDGKIPNKYEGEIAKRLSKSYKTIENNIENFKLNLALDEIWKLISELNKYLNEKEPWKIKKRDQLEKIMYELTEALRIISILIYPFIPNTSEKIRKQLGLDEKVLWKNLEWGKLEPKTKTKKEEILFKKFENKLKQGDNLITLDDLAKIDLRVAEIKEAEEIENSDKLIKIKIDIGEEEKQIVAGIKQHYKPEELIGKQRQ